MFLTRTSCRKTAHADGYHGAWRVGGFSQCAPVTVGTDTVRKKSELCGLRIPPRTQKKTVLHRTPILAHLASCMWGAGVPSGQQTSGPGSQLLAATADNRQRM